MPHRSIASLSINFGLVSIPVKLYSATHSTAAIRFKLMSSSAERIRQQYVAEPSPRLPEIEESPATPQISDARRVPEPLPAGKRNVPSDALKVVNFPQRALPLPHAQDAAPPAVDAVIERSSLRKGYEYEQGHFVLFTPEELKALEAASRRSIDIISFIPERAVDPIYYDKAYLLAPDKSGSKPYSLLHRAMADSERCALAKWAFRGKEYVTQLRAARGGLVLQQLFYADEVRPIEELHIEMNPVGEAELSLARQLVAQISAETYDPKQFVDEEKLRILDAVKAKLAGRQLAEAARSSTSGQVVDLLQALRASLQGHSQSASAALRQRKPPKRALRRPTDVRSSSRKGSRR